MAQPHLLFLWSATYIVDQDRIDDLPCVKPVKVNLPFRHIVQTVGVEIFCPPVQLCVRPIPEPLVRPYVFADTVCALRATDDTGSIAEPLELEGVQASLEDEENVRTVGVERR
jgi:hypothetical protein